MKLVAIISCFFLFSCSGDDEFSIPDYYSGSVNADFNGKAWSALIHGFNVSDINTYGIMVANYNSENIIREVLTLARIPRQLGEYQLSSNLSLMSSLYTTIVSDGDVTCDIYYLDDDYNNRIEITSFDHNGSNIEGNFELTFYHIRPNYKCDINVPDTLKFRNGVFQTRITR